MTETQTPQEKQAELQEAYMKLELIKSQLDGLGQQNEIYELTTSEIARAKETVENIRAGDPNKDVLIPLGGDTYLYATISNISKLLINIGAGTIVEKDPAEAVDILEKRLDNLNTMNQNIIQSISNLQQQASDLSMKIQALSQEIQGQVNKNVSGAP